MKNLWNVQVSFFARLKILLALSLTNFLHGPAKKVLICFLIDDTTDRYNSNNSSDDDDDQNSHEKNVEHGRKPWYNG